MRNNRWMFLALMLFMSAFFLPVTAYASGPADSRAPVISARVSEKTLVIEASDEDSGVESVFIDGQETAYPAEGPLEADLWNYAGAGQYVSAYAVDYAGNRSGTVKVENPYYKASLTEDETDESAVPEQSSAFTPDGSGTVLDNVTDEEGKEFFTITTPDENIFYLIIDRAREDGNVYFLNAVTEDDLLSLAQKEDSGKNGESAVPTSESASEPEASPDSGETASGQNQSGGDSTLIFVLLAAVIAGGAGYYFKIYKPKHQAADAEEPEYDENDEEYDTEPDIPDSEDTQDDFLSPEDEFGDPDDPPEEEDQL
ncbi:hypothetical protein OXPF_15590 [Oxobacter pfennigii]|uniref:Mobile element protein CD1107-like domain-containing protein n=1 Tax=Oxobacter pfennigii TaxID=36849 RepID=A0A0P8YCZ8_9CLOT|nr:DUF4366 domain-containing protein [Oxobacter pfennigii]KPU45081.1 hypothetical protein OXPF_15590 [Oxobacter pfennigii]